MRIVYLVMLVIFHQSLCGGINNAPAGGVMAREVVLGGKISTSSDSDHDQVNYYRRSSSDSIRVNFSRYYYSNKGWKKKSNIADDEKRMVPTGPNPLHNR